MPFATHRFALSINDSLLYFIGLTGAVSFGQAVEVSTGEPIVFWVSALMGGILLRRAIVGSEAGSLAFFPVATGIFIAWLLTTPIMNTLSVDPDAWRPGVAAFTAALGEHVLRIVAGIVLDPEWIKGTLRRALKNWLGDE